MAVFFKGRSSCVVSPSWGTVWNSEFRGSGSAGRQVFGPGWDAMGRAVRS
jgi:hypothetical protein